MKLKGKYILLTNFNFELWSNYTIAHLSLLTCTLCGVKKVFKPVSIKFPPLNVPVKDSGLG